MSKKLTAIGSSLAALVLVPAPLAAQACIASPASHGDARISPRVSFTDGATSYGGSLGVFTTGPVFLAGGFGVTDFEDSETTGNAAQAAIGGELAATEVSLCPQLEVSYAWLGNLPPESEQNGIALQAGMGIGKSLGDELVVTPFGSAVLVQSWTSIRGTFLGSEIDTTNSDTGGAFTAGLTVGSRRAYVGPSVRVTTFEGSDPLFAVTGGVIF